MKKETYRRNKIEMWGGGDGREMKENGRMEWGQKPFYVIMYCYVF